MPANPITINELKEAFFSLKKQQKHKLWQSKLKCYQKLF